MPDRRPPEVLAPAGDRSALEAAVSAGADAVYFGLGSHNARERARNFSSSELEETLRFLHRHRVRGYVTLNTLVTDAELGDIEAMVRVCADTGVDALIVQDLGVATLARAVAPGLPLHASTQMTCSNARAAEHAATLGLKRIILPRELSLEQIRAYGRETPLELEVFVHGALCVSYSGQCNASQTIFGKSANRGRCLQPCRLPYDLVVDGRPLEIGRKAYPLSPLDLDAHAVVSELVALGVRALKIEGRMKGPDYVYSATRLYRKAVDAACGGTTGPDKDDVERVEQAFSRGLCTGFLTGTNHQGLVEGETSDHRGVLVGVSEGSVQQRGKQWVRLELMGPLSIGDGILVQGGRGGVDEVGGRVWELRVEGVQGEEACAGALVSAWLGPDKRLPRVAAGRKVWRTSTRQAPPRLEHEVSSRHPVRMHLTGVLGERPVLEALDAHGAVARVSLDSELAAADSRLTDELLRDKLGRLGGSPFVLEALVTDLPERARIPVSSLNRARRAVIDQLLSQWHNGWPTTSMGAAELVARAHTGEGFPSAAPSGCFVRCERLEQARAALQAGADGVYLDAGEAIGGASELDRLRRETRKAIGVALPRVMEPLDEPLLRALEQLPVDLVLVGSLSSLVAHVPQAVLIGGASLNVSNTLSAVHLLRAGLACFTPCQELPDESLLELLSGQLAGRAEVLIYGHEPLFYTKHCLFAANLASGATSETCGKPCRRSVMQIRDRTGRTHPVLTEPTCRNRVYHGEPTSRLACVDSLSASGVRRFRIEITGAAPSRVREIVETCRIVLDRKLAPASAERALGARRPPCPNG
jgi:putative protease